MSIQPYYLQVWDVISIASVVEDHAMLVVVDAIASLLAYRDTPKNVPLLTRFIIVVKSLVLVNLWSKYSIGFNHEADSLVSSSSSPFDA